MNSCKIDFKFQAKDRNSDEIIEYKIITLPENFYQPALELYKRDFIPDETMISTKGIHKSKEAIDEICNYWLHNMKNNLALGCFRSNNEDELVAVNIVCTKFKEHNSENEFELKDPLVKDLFEAIDYTFKKADIFKVYGVDKFMASFALVVDRNYRGRGIATEILKARIPLMKEMGIEVTSTCFSIIGSQRAAEKAGFVEDYVISYADFAKISPRYVFSKDLSKKYKIMTLKLN